MILTPAALAQARAAQCSTMTDRLLIERPDGTTAGQFSTTKRWRTIWDGIGRLLADQKGDSAATLGGRDVRPGGYIAAIPWDAPMPQEGDRVTVGGLTLTVRSVEKWSTYLTARRFTVEE